MKSRPSKSKPVSEQVPKYNTEVDEEIDKTTYNNRRFGRQQRAMNKAETAFVYLK